MNETLRLLVELQKLDSQILATHTKIEAADARMSAELGSLQAAQDARDNALKEHNALETQRRDRERAIEEVNEKLRKVRQRGAEIKTNKEYQAHLKEIEAIQAEVSRCEDELLAVMERLDESAKAVREKEAVLTIEKEQQGEARKAIEQQKTGLETDLASLRQQRKALADILDDGTYRRYMDIIKLGRGLAVVEARQEICQGCNLHIPPQLFVEIKANTEIIQCPQCRRFLHYVRPEEAPKTGEDVNDTAGRSGHLQ